MKKIASAATIKIDARKVEITGTAAISNITGLNNGDVVTIYPAAAFTFATGGNINAAMTAVADAPFQIILREGVVHTLTLPTTNGARIGEWTSVAYDAGNFTANTGNWTVDSADISSFAYTLVGKTITINFVISASDVSAGASSLRITIPGGFTAGSGLFEAACWYNDAGAGWNPGLIQVVGGATYLAIYKSPGAPAWTITAADNTSVRGQISLAVV